MPYDRPDAPADLRALELFCNSARFLYAEDAFSEPGTAAHWLRKNRFLPAGIKLDHADVERLVAFREAVREHLGGTGDPALLNAEAEKTIRAVGWAADRTPALTPAARGVDAVIAGLLDLLFRADLTGRARRLRPCRAPDCRWIFYDRSPTANGVWCSMDICGARNKMRTYRSRQRP